MMLRLLPAALLLVLLSPLVLAGEEGSIEIRVEGLRNDEGQVFVSLFNQAEGFPGGKEPPFRTLGAKSVNGKATVVFENIAYGEYAVAVHHDEDGDGKMKTVYGTIPQEGIGISRDAKGMMGPPKFNDARFDLQSATVVMTIKVTY